MKPTKNRVFCLECRRSKQLFETEAQANNFIKFNRDEIMESEDKVPVRSYYCISCGGWHVTSQSVYNRPSKSERVMEKMKQRIQERQKVYSVYNQKINDAKKNIKVLVETLPTEYEKVKETCQASNSLEEQLEHIMAFRNRLIEIRTTMALTKSKRRLVHYLEEESKRYYYTVKHAV